MPESRLIRRVAELPQVGGRQLQWIPQVRNATNEACEDNDNLQWTQAKVLQSLRRNGNVLPTGLDDMLPDAGGNPWFNMTKYWEREVVAWTRMTARSAGSGWSWPQHATHVSAGL